MRFTIRSLLFFLLALLPVIQAETVSSTFYLTRTVYRVVTETETGKAPETVLNSTTTYSTSVGTLSAAPATGNGTLITTGAPTATATGVGASSSATSTGAGAQVTANALVAAIIAGVGYMAL